MKISRPALIVVILSLWLAGAQAAGDPEAGRAKSATCTACHGADGNSPSPEWPKLAGQHARYLAETLRAFRAGTRTGTLMNGLAAGLTDEDIEDLAAFYAAQEIRPGETDPKLLPYGQRVYRGGVAEAEVPACMACHGPNGRGNPASAYPGVAGQHAQYVYTALQAYADGLVDSGNSQIMTDIARRMTERDMRAVATYIEGLR